MSTVKLGENNHRFHYGSFAYRRSIDKCMMDRIKAAPETQALVQSLANCMGRAECDVMMLAKGVINDLIKEGLDELFVDSDIDTQSDLVQAYAFHQQKKFSAFHTTYLTNPQAAQAN